MNRNAWLDPVAFLCQHEHSVWLHSYGEIRKVAACRVKPYELVNREIAKNEEVDVKKQVMLEDGLKDGLNLLTYLDKDSVGAKYLKMSNSVSFSNMCSHVIELPVSENWRPEVKIAKKNEIKNLTDCDIFEEVKDEGQETIVR